MSTDFARLEVEEAPSSSSSMYHNNNSQSRCKSIKCNRVVAQRATGVFGLLTCFIIAMYIAVQVGMIADTLKPPIGPQIDNKIQTSFFSVVYGASGSPPAPIFMFSVPNKVLGKLFIFSELIERGNGHDAVAHTQPSPNGIPMFFNKSTDSTQLLLYRKQLAVRASNKRDKILLEDGVSDFLIASLPIYSSTNDMHIISGSSLINTHFGIPFESETFAGPNHVRVVETHGYPTNLDFILEIQAQNGDGATMRTFVSLALLPEKKMISRVADHRIGYFATEYTNIGIHPTITPTKEDSKSVLPESVASYEVDPTINVINRWRLEKNSEQCDNPIKMSGCLPIKPIIYYVDPTVPDIWRKYVKLGIELWQPAFAALGFKDTPRAILPGDADFPEDYDSGDIRYASVSFAVSRDYVFSVGPSITDPRTGEILDADIGFSQEWVHAFSGQLSRETLDAAGATAAEKDEGSEHRRRLRSIRGLSSFHSRHNCNKERLHQHLDDISALMASLNVAADLSDTNGRVSTEVIGRGLAGVTVHEVGHTLGLRHNFAGSTAVSYASIYDKTKTLKTGSSSSVMDYVGPVVAPTSAQQKASLVFPDGHTIGEYDRLAIEYGYTPVVDEISDRQHPDVRAIADKSKTKDLSFATDDDASFDTDPLARRYDMTDNPIAYAQDQFQVGVRMRQGGAIFSKWHLDQGYASSTTNLLLSALRIQKNAAKNGAYHLGGRVIDHHYSSPSSSVHPVRPVHPGYQEQGLSLIHSFLDDDIYWSSSGGSGASTPSQQIMYLNPYGLGMNYGLDVSNIALKYQASLVEVLSSVVEIKKLVRIHQTNEMLLKLDAASSSSATTTIAQLWSPPGWQPKKGATKTMSIYDVLRSLTNGIWKSWKYNDWASSRHCWSLINFWTQMVVDLHTKSAANPVYFQVEIDTRTVIEEIITNLTATASFNAPASVASFVNVTLQKLKTINKE